jgi:ABC-type multidrug transport system fused ATPase/permease subunit
MMENAVTESAAAPLAPPSPASGHAAGTGAALPVRMEARNLNFFYGSSQALHEISIRMRERAVTAFIGPSGCGKSTFLRCLNRMNDIIPGTRVEGDVLLDGTDIYARTWTSWTSGAASAWSSRSPTRSRSPFSTTSPTA